MSPPGPSGRRSKWFLPAFVLAFGLAIFGAQALGGHPDRGVWALVAMGALAVVLLLSGRSETVKGLRGDGRDERFAMIDRRASAVAGTALTLAVLVAWLVEIARGRDGSPYTWLASIAGVAYIVAIAFLRWRS